MNYTPTTIKSKLASLALISCLSLTPTTMIFAADKNDQVTLNFDEASIVSIAKTMATITNRNIVLDPNVKGEMTLMTNKPISASEAWNQFISALRLRKYTIVESAGIYKVVPEGIARLQTTKVIKGNQPPKENQVVTQVFKLNYENVNQVLPILRPLISVENTINVSAGSNTIVITDYADNIKRMAQIIASLDTPQASNSEVIILKHSFAKDVAELITKSLINENRLNNIKPVVLPDLRTNSVIIRAQSESQLKQIRSMVTQLDTASAGSELSNIKVVYLKNSTAKMLSETLNTLFKGAAGAAAGSVSSSGSQSSSKTSSPGSDKSISSSFDNSSRISGTSMVLADETNNALIINAPEPIYRQLRNVIDLLDGRRAQVYIETLIAEVNTSKIAELGVQWQSLAGKTNNHIVGVIGTNYGDEKTGNIFNTAASLYGFKKGGSLPAAMPNIGQGFNIAAAVKSGGAYVLGAIANFIQTNGDGNILSTPNILTLNNEEAIIKVGQNVPILAGVTQGTNGASPFQDVERKDIGIELKVKPQISENGSILMDIFQESSSIDKTMESNSGYILNQRSIKSKVVIEDGQIIVIGGLLSEVSENSVSKVPLLGDIPIIGNLFKNDSKKRIKNNLMVFIRPVIVRNGDDALAYSTERHNLMRKLQENADSPINPLMYNIEKSQVLPIGNQDIPKVKLSATAPLINVLPTSKKTKPKKYSD